MRLPGWCEKCRRVRTVNVKVPRPGALQIGTCQQCEDEERAKTLNRRRAR